MTQPEVELRRAWRHVAGAHHDAIIDALLLRYAEPHRHYHTATHVMMVLRHIADIAAASAYQVAAELQAAALYHDAIYDPRATNNEGLSAALATRDLTTIGWNAERCSTVESLIIATAGHVESGAPAHEVGTDTAIMLDADLAILGSEPLHYQAYANLVRAEYSFVDDDGWRAGRTAVLRTFLDRDRLFRTDVMHRRCEQRARANIETELATLQGTPEAD